MATRFVSDHPLRVAPELLGRPLASPMRRLLAAAIDGVPLFLLMVASAMGAAALSLRVSDPAGFDALRLLRSKKATPEALHSARREAARLLTQLEVPGLPPAVVLAVEEGRLDDAADALAARELDPFLNLGESEPLLVVGRSEGRISPGHIRIPIKKLIPAPIRAAVVLGVPALYFTLLTSLWGATLGKRLVGARVVRLDAERLSLLEAFERFTGYLHIPALLGWPIIDLWRNPNRQLPHDRTVHTVVIRSQCDDVRQRPAGKNVRPGVERAPVPGPPDARPSAKTNPLPEPAAPLPGSRPPSPPEPER